MGLLNGDALRAGGEEMVGWNIQDGCCKSARKCILLHNAHGRGDRRPRHRVASSFCKRRLLPSHCHSFHQMVWRVELEFDERASCHTPSNHFTTSILSNSLFPAWILPTRINNFTCIDWNSSTTMEGFKKKKKSRTKDHESWLSYLFKKRRNNLWNTNEREKEGEELNLWKQSREF